MMWEYHIESIDFARDASRQLNVLGRDGWELMWLGRGQYSRETGIFKRPARLDPPLEGKR